MGSSAVIAQTFLQSRTHAETLKLLLRVCLRSNLRREPGRWPGVSPQFLRVKPAPFRRVPAHIALQGGERAGADAICPCPSQERAINRDMSGRLTAPGLGDRRGQMVPGRAAHTLPSLRHTCGGVLAEPSYNNKKRGWGQCFRSFGQENALSAEFSAQRGSGYVKCTNLGAAYRSVSQDRRTHADARSQRRIHFPRLHYLDRRAFGAGGRSIFPARYAAAVFFY